ncbi:disks large-associated protein 5-like [Centruroides vittatus]|uniref:disks large-associated protein 5-like n=1 Tax=Centruroides vittatus TaxID=120091 RepID=UPI00350F3108
MGDALYFRQLLQNKTDEFQNLCVKWQDILQGQENVSEEVQGQIYLAIGQAQLLINERFSQFSGLIDKCEFNLDDKLVTCDDLQGFWDMIYIQIADIEKKFELLEKMKENNWQLKTDNESSVNIKNSKKQKKYIPKARSRNNCLQEHILKARKKLMGKENYLENKSDMKTFEVPGFFVVNSPMKSPASFKQYEKVKTPISTSVQNQNKTPKSSFILTSVTQSAKKLSKSKQKINFDIQ